MMKAGPKPVRILLGKATSDHLTATGESCFVVVSKAMRSDEGSAGLWAIHLLPCDLDLANKAVGVARGELRATKPRSKP